MKIALLRSWSIWSEPLTKECVDEKIFAKFNWANGMWKEFSGCIFGISDVQMQELLKSGYAKKLN